MGVLFFAESVRKLPILPTARERSGATGCCVIADKGDNGPTGSALFLNRLTRRNPVFSAHVAVLENPQPMTGKDGGDGLINELWS